MNARPAPPLISILTPIYNEQENLPAYDAAVREVLLSRTDCAFEIWLIDDGSSDRSWPTIQAICARDSRFHGLRLSRNQGSHTALTAGFAHARGDAVATLACDLQDPPETILRFIEQWRTGSRIVWGHRRTRGDQFWRVAASGLFCRLIKRFAMPRGSRFATGSFFLVDRQVADCYRQFREQNRITFALVAWTGFDQARVEYDRRPRLAGTSGWNLRGMFKAFYDTFIGFSFLPVRLITWLGLAVSLVTLVLAGYVVLSWLSGNPLPGWSSLMLVQALFFGIQFLLMGLVGEYLYRIYAEVVRRPLYFISDTAGEGTPAEGSGPPSRIQNPQSKIQNRQEALA